MYFNTNMIFSLTETSPITCQLAKSTLPFLCSFFFLARIFSFYALVVCACASPPATSSEPPPTLPALLLLPFSHHHPTTVCGYKRSFAPRHRFFLPLCSTPRFVIISTVDNDSLLFVFFFFLYIPAY